MENFKRNPHYVEGERKQSVKRTKGRRDEDRLESERRRHPTSRKSTMREESSDSESVPRFKDYFKDKGPTMGHKRKRSERELPLPSSLPFSQVTPNNEESDKEEIMDSILAELNGKTDPQYIMNAITLKDSLGDSLKAFQVNNGTIHSLGPNFLCILIIPSVSSFDSSKPYRIKFTEANFMNSNVREYDIPNHVNYETYHRFGYLFIFIYGKEAVLKTPLKPGETNDSDGFFKKMGMSLITKTFNYITNKFY